MVDKNSFFSLARLKEFGLEYVVTGVFAPLPTPIGSFIRNIFYKLILREIGTGVYLAPGVRLIGTKHIQLHQQVRARDGVFIQSFGNPITLSQGVQIGRYGAIRSFQGRGGSIEIGEQTSIGFYTYIGGPGKISIGKHCLIAMHVSINANNHNFGEIDVPIGKQGMTCEGITIEDNCWIGAGARILDGVTIGKGSVIGAGAVVNKDVPPYSVAVGVPAKVVKRYAQTNHTAGEVVSMPRSNYELTAAQFSDSN